jgi:ubiquinone/menaquinone biosynthesis C-methylase UbiE
MPDAVTMFNDGAAYERLMGRWSQKVGRTFLEWLAPAPGQDWLDVGCGNGAFTEVIRSRDNSARLTGLDPSEGQIAYARQRQSTSGADFHVGDAQSLPFADASFDVTVMALAIAFVPDPARGVRELARVTRPDGISATYMWDLPGGGVPLAPLYDALRSQGHPAPQPPSPEASTRDALHQLWTDAGFAGVETKVFGITVTFDDFQDFWQSNTVAAGPLAPILRGLSEAERERLQAHLRENLPSDDKGRIAFPAVANAVKGHRPA